MISREFPKEVPTISPLPQTFIFSSLAECNLHYRPLNNIMSSFKIIKLSNQAARNIAGYFPGRSGHRSSQLLPRFFIFPSPVECKVRCPPPGRHFFGLLERPMLATGSQQLHRTLWVQAGNGLMRFHLTLGGQRCSTPPLPEYVIVPIEKA